MEEKCLPRTKRGTLNSQTRGCSKLYYKDYPQTCDYALDRQTGDIEAGRHHPAMPVFSGVKQ